MGALLWIFAVIVFVVTPAMAESPSMMTILKQMKAISESSKSEYEARSSSLRGPKWLDLKEIRRFSF